MPKIKSLNKLNKQFLRFVKVLDKKLTAFNKVFPENSEIKLIKESKVLLSKFEIELIFSIKLSIIFPKSLNELKEIFNWCANSVFIRLSPNFELIYNINLKPSGYLKLFLKCFITDSWQVDTTFFNSFETLLNIIFDSNGTFLLNFSSKLFLSLVWYSLLGTAAIYSSSCLKFFFVASISFNIFLEESAMIFPISLLAIAFIKISINLSIIISFNILMVSSSLDLFS